jgi:hypothetical protein
MKNGGNPSSATRMARYVDPHTRQTVAKARISKERRGTDGNV